MVWVRAGWYAQTRSRFALCDWALNFFSSQATCGTCYGMWNDAGAETVKANVADEKRRKWEAEAEYPKQADDASQQLAGQQLGDSME